MIHRFFRHIKEGFYGVGRHLGMALSSATAVMITLVLISLFLILTILNKIQKKKNDHCV